MDRSEDIKSLQYVIEEGTGCHIVVTQKNVKIEEDNGYAICRSRTRIIRAHRLSFEKNIRPLKNGEIVRHSCDNRLCINPLHLCVGSKADNSNDMKQRGRASNWDDRPMAKNGKRSRSKLSKEQIKEIKESDKSSYALAKIYGVSSTHIRRIKNGSRCSTI